MKKIKTTVALIAEDTVSVFAAIVEALEKLDKRVWDLEQKAMEKDELENTIAHAILVAPTPTVAEAKEAADDNK